MKNKELKNTKPSSERIRDFLQKGNDPYSFNATNGLSIEISFADDGRGINHKLAKYFSENIKI